MKTLYPNKNYHRPELFLVDAENAHVGRLATKVATLLMGKQTRFFTPGVNQQNIVIILNVNRIKITGCKTAQKFYFSNSGRPGSLKKENFKELQKRLPARIIEKAVKGMLPKGILGRKYFKCLYTYEFNKVF